MKSRITVFIAVVLAITMVTGTVAFAATPGQSEQSAQPSDQPTDQGKGADKLAKAQERLEFLKEAQPLIQQIAANRIEIREMRLELAAVRKQAKEHIRSLKQNAGSLTDEQIELISSLIAELKSCRETLRDTNKDMVQHRGELRLQKKNRNYDAILAAYGNIIRIQEERMQKIGKLIEINKQIAAV